MNPRTLRVLEYHKIRSMLAEYTSFSLGAERVRWLEPSASLETVERWQEETAQAVDLLNREPAVPLGGLSDITAEVRKAEVGSTLNPEELLRVNNCLYGIRRLADFLRDKAEHQPLLHSLGTSMETFVDVEKRIQWCINEEGEVVDRASKELARIRSQIRTCQNRVKEKLDSILHNPSYQRILQDNIVTLRNGRYVVPIRADQRSALPGIVHDQSGTGATLFVEPAPVVELNNRIRQLEAEEREEIHRILQQLTALVSEQAKAIVYSLELAGRVDFIIAKARFAHALRATRPELNSRGEINILRGRHPLLGKDVVPLDLSLGRGRDNILVITGPNTGGKTVALKTVGLLTLMAQAGLHVPASDGTILAVFDGVYADIGDEQSIEQSLSTFSSHMTNIVGIMKSVTQNSLVLLDELGAGTDPTEGACLAMAILATLNEKRVRTIATTHYSELKTFAHTTEGLVNASVEFDVETLRPTYRLLIGVPGRSNAFAISKRLGLSEEIIQLAKAFMTGEQLQVEDLIIGLEQNRRQSQEDRALAEQYRREMEELKNTYEAKLAQVREERDEILAQAKAEAERILQEAKTLADESLGRLRKLVSSQGDSKADDVQEAKAIRDILTEARQEFRTAEKQPAQRRAVSSQPSAALTAGCGVWIKSLRQRGEVLEVGGDGTVLVQVGPMKVSVPAADLQVEASSTTSQPRKTSPQSGLARFRSSKTQVASTELDLRGATVEEALARTDKYLDDLVVAGISKCRIIHGKGTGALRSAINELLERYELVQAHYYAPPAEGGDGVTIVELAR